MATSSGDARTTDQGRTGSTANEGSRINAPRAHVHFLYLSFFYLLILHCFYNKYEGQTAGRAPAKAGRTPPQGEALTTAGTGEASGADDDGSLAARGNHHWRRRTLKPGDYQRRGRRRGATTDGEPLTTHGNDEPQRRGRSISNGAPPAGNLHLPHVPCEPEGVSFSLFLLAICARIISYLNTCI